MFLSKALLPIHLSRRGPAEGGIDRQYVLAEPLHCLIERCLLGIDLPGQAIIRSDGEPVRDVRICRELPRNGQITECILCRP